MGKAKKPREAQKPELPTASSDAGSGVARKPCSHYHHDAAHLDKVVLEILCSNHVAACKLCPEDTPTKKGGAGSKEKGGKQHKKGGGARGAATKVQAKAEKSNMWVCLDCGRHFCATAGTKPYGHARTHAKQDKHCWAAKYDDPSAAYCFSCDREVSIKMAKSKTVVDDEVVGAAGTDGASGTFNVIKCLPNRGNTCCFNAVLQNILALGMLRRKMLGRYAPKKGPLSMPLKKLFVETSASNDTGDALSPDNLFSNICSVYSQFKGHRMQDSLELLHCFLDGLRTEETAARKVAKDASNAGAPTIVDSIFAGELSIIVGSTAECSHSSIKHDKFLVLSLPVPSRRPPADQVALVGDNVTVLCCLSLYTGLELLSEPWLCEQCTNAARPNICERKNAVEMMDNANERKEGEEMMAGGGGGDDNGQDNQNKQKEDNTKVFRSAKRRIYISKAPPVLVIHLKRLSQDCHDQHEKLKVHQEENGNHDNITYRLVGIVEHMETMEGGHYIAYVRGDKIGGQRQQKSGYKAWFYARDGKVRKVWILQVLDQVLEPDLLFNERVDGGGQFMDSNFPAVDLEANNTSSKLNERNEETTVKPVEGKGYSNPIEVSSPPDQMDKMGACIYLELNQKLLPPPVPEDIIIPSDGGQKLNHKLQQPLAREDIAIFESAGNLTGEESWLTETHGNVIKGLPNLGNTCFFNVALQNLLALDTLRSKMLGPNVWTGPLAIPLKKLFVETSASNDTGGALSPHILFSYICSRFPQFKGSHMQDSHELLSLFLDGLHTDEIEARKLAQDASNAGVPTIVESIFGGELSSTVSSLECPHSSVKHDQFLDLSLPLPSRKSNSSDHEVDNTEPEYVMALSSNSVDDEVDNSNAAVSVEDCLASYTKEDPLSWHCEHCNDKTKVFRAATQRLLISKAPPALMITLKRFRRISSSESKKLEGHVCFEEMLDIGPFMDSRSEENDNTTYRLVGVVQHKGTPIEGHYIAYVRAGKVGGQQQQQSSGSKSWFYASDLEVRKASLEEVLSCEAYLLFYERCLTNPSQSSVKLTGEGSQLIDVDEQLRSGAPVHHSPPLPPPKKEAPWEFPRGNNRNKRRENAKAREDAKVAQQIGVFLDRFTLSGESMPYYRSQLVGMVERGFGSGDLNILYSHLLSYSKDLAMKVCNGYKRLRVILTETATEFVQQVVTTELNLTETARKFMQQLVTMESAQSLKLKFLDMPKVHKLLKHCLSGPLLVGMNVYGHKGQPIKTPLPDKCAMIQELLDYVLSKHRAGFSWKGNFTIDDMEVYDGKVVITKCPKSFPKNPQISGKMVTAMEMDFAGIAKSVLQKFLCPGFVVPYLTTFYTMLSGMGSYAKWWCDRVTAEALRELIQHHPFLKPSMARSNLLSGIHGACRSHDTGDETALFKTILQLEVPTNPWIGAFRWELNPVLQKTFRHKDLKMKFDPNQNEPLEYFGYYQNNLEFLVEYLRNLSQHGTARSFEYRRLIKRDDGTLFDPNPKLRKQFIQSLDELEVAGAVLLDKYVMRALTLLLKSSAMKGMLRSVWDCYKNCNYSF